MQSADMTFFLDSSFPSPALAAMSRHSFASSFAFLTAMVSFLSQGVMHLPSLASKTLHLHSAMNFSACDEGLVEHLNRDQKHHLFD